MKFMGTAPLCVLYFDKGPVTDASLEYGVHDIGNGVVYQCLVPSHLSILLFDY